MAQDTLPMVVYWHENQVAITFRSPEKLSAKRASVIASLHLDRLEQFLDENGFTLTTFQEEDLLHLPPSTDVSLSDDQTSSMVDGRQQASIDSPSGKYLFASPDNKGTSIVSFFHIETKNSNSGAAPVTEAMDADIDQYGYAAADTGMQSDYYANDITLKAVCLVNEHLAALQNAEVPIVSAMPNWLKGGAMVGCIIEGCTITPPLPVDADDIPGRWKSVLPEYLPTTLQAADGAGVTVLVLDTLRPYQDVAAVAISEAGATNSLLQDIVKNVTFNYNDLPPILDHLNPEQPGTGKDVYGRLIGFPMSDHGIFVAGIVRDLAPGAHVECIRVLNDFGVGNATGLMHVLESIQDRLRHVEGAGSPLNLPLVVNLSLTGTPSDEVLLADPYHLAPAQVYQLREGLYEAIQSLAAQGVVFVASAGNDSDPRIGSPTLASQRSTATTKRFGPRYPAAFAYDEVMPGQATRVGISAIIPVGAINQTESAASYSNYPGVAGIATYGGELPTPDPKDVFPTPPPALPYSIPTKITEPVDALRGVYTSALFPAPSMDDRLVPVPDSSEGDYPEYQPAEATTWAYWVGTSFATPIVSAITARLLQNPGSSGDTVRKVLLDVSKQKPLWTGLNTQLGEAASGNVIMVTQEYVASPAGKHKIGEHECS